MRLSALRFASYFVWSVATVATALLSPCTASAQSAPSVQLAAGERSDVLVMFDGFPDLSGAAQLASKEEKGAYVFAALQQHRRQYAPLLTNLRTRGIATQELWVAGAVYVPQADAALVAELSRSGRVVATSAFELREVSQAKASAQQRGGSTTTWGLDYMNVPAVWAQGIRGSGAVIGGQDTGYDWDHPALKPSYRGYTGDTTSTGADSVIHDYSWHDAVHRQSPNNANDANPCGYDSTEPCDDGSHGTHTMGTMVGEDGANQVGVAPEAQWIGCRNMDRGDGTAEQYLECFQWFVAPTDLNGENPRPELAPDVIANSWYCPLSEGCDTSTYPAFNNAVAALRAAGVVVVVSAGNDGRAGCNTVNDIPARVPGVIAVAAHDVNGSIAGFSSRGGDDVANWPDIAAPGVNVRSTTPNSNYANFSGTSMAGPHVAGMVALMVSANPALRGQVDVIEEMLLRAATPVLAPPGDTCSGPEVTTPNAVFGHGYADAQRAVDLALGYTVSSTHSASAKTLNVVAAPNPVREVLTLRLPAAAVGANIRIVSVSGEVVFTSVVASERLDVLSGDWPAGMYAWQVAGTAGIASGRVLKH